MLSLSTELRNKLERTIIQARDVAEAGAKAGLEALAVHHHEPYVHMSIEDRNLRNHLRAKARQLSDKQNPKGELEITHLVWECAYEHWHRMLFARFLAENDLLIEPEMGVAINLEECEELAKEDGKDLWTLASEFAQRMLPQIFRPNDPVLKVFLAREHRIKLENLLNDLEPAIFTVSDSLGWVYQFWQSKRKKEVNQSGNKIGADELPAVTQLFTEPYMVSFLLDNSLGAWWAARCDAGMGRHGDGAKGIFERAETEEELRKACAIPGVPLEYLRFVKVGEASSLCEIDGRMPLPPYKEIGYFHKEEPVANLTGDLPHWRQEGVTYFVTFRTADSLPQEKLKQWQFERDQWLHDHPEPHDEKTKREFYASFPERLQHWLDQGYGECVLQEDKFQNIVEGALRYFDGERYELDEFVIMPNHVHVLVTPKAGYELSKILHSWKSFTASEINKQTGKIGAFWQKESFDHIVRSPAQVEKIRRYIKDQSGRGFQPLENQRQDAAATLPASIWQPAAGTFDGWPERLSELKILDPCCGSGHFLVAAFLMLVPMRMELEGLSAREAVDAVLKRNLHGLEIDQRCVELAAFALAITAWNYQDAGGYRVLPELNIACSGLSVSVAKDEWKQLGLGKGNLAIALDWMHKTFKDAPLLGSLLNPVKSPLPVDVNWQDIQPLLEQALKQEQSDEQQEVAVVAHGLAKAATLLTGKYQWVITNVPYLARGKQDERLRAFCERHYPAAKNDLATVFIERCLEFCESSRGFQPLGQGGRGFQPLDKQRQDAAASIGTASVVLPQNWLFLTTYKKFREKLLKNDTWHLIARLGPGAFETISGEVVKAILIIMSRGNKVAEASSLWNQRQDAAAAATMMIRGVDVSQFRTVTEKAAGLLPAEIKSVEQAKQLENPDARVALEQAEDIELLEKYADGLVGLQTSDDPMFISAFWEHGSINKDVWEYLQATPDIFNEYAGQSWLVRWEKGEGLLLSLPTAYPTKGLKALGKSGIAIHRMGQLFPYYYGRERFHQNVATIIPKDSAHLPAIWCFCSSSEYNEMVRQIDQSLKVTNATLVKVPFDLGHWTEVAKEKYPKGLPKPYSDDPTQWIFHGHPCGSVVWDGEVKWTAHGPLRSDDTVLQVAVARLLGYRWPSHDEWEKRRRGETAMDLSEESWQWVEKSRELEVFADKNGIVCIPSVRGEQGATDRLLDLLACAHAHITDSPLPPFSVSPPLPLSPSFSDWVQRLLEHAENSGKTIETWLRDHFFEQHCKLFHHRPFIWHIWDGRRRDGFHALVNYHKLAEGNGKGRQLLENLTYSYLGEWIARQKEGIKRGEGGAEDRLAAALELQKRLIAIIEGEPPFDIFVRWKPIEEQPIGWEPDINDGVRLNIRPFLPQDIPGGRKGAGILRWKPNITWGKDRGKDVASAPWFPLFKGDRINDHHLSLEEKRAARAEANRRKGETERGRGSETENG